MNISFENAKNASPTCVVDGRFLHSKYNPENEAKTFVANIDCNFNPSCIIITGIALPYCIPFLKEKFPKTPIYSIVYDQQFAKNTECEKCFLCTKSTSTELLSEEIFSHSGEVILSAVLALSWKPSESIFNEENSIAWKAIKSVIQKTRDIIATRAYFSQRWLKNSIKFCSFTKNIATITKQAKPILIVASGASLKESLPHIAKYQNDFFILAVSSAICTLTENSIIPDMCLSTDGGFYAKHHLEVLINLHKNGISIPLAISTESNVPSYILENCPIIPLTYNDGLESTLLKLCKIPAILAERNGTVSGNASVLAMQLTDQNIYTCGLDLANGKGYSHTQPNAHEKIHSQKDFKVRSLETRICPKPISSQELSPMDIYRQWFETRNTSFSKRFFRISKQKYSRSLGLIEDLTWQEINVEKITSECNNISFQSVLENAERQNILRNFFEDEKNYDKFAQEIAFAEWIATKKYPNSAEIKEKFENTVFERIANLKGLYL